MQPMSPTGFSLPLLCLIAALVTAALLVRRFGAPAPQGRYHSIDGLRGYLALAVFLCHVAVWYAYLRTGRWADSDSRLYRQFGEASVVLFFMITAFLFYSKLLNSPGRFDWKQLYLSRVARIVPLYLVVVLAVFAIVGYLTDWTLRVPVGALLFRGLEWLALGLLGAPALNEFSGASVIVAGVIWSLAYEALFYAWLPLLCVTVPNAERVRGALLSVSVVAIVCFVLLHLAPVRLLGFLGGIAAAVLVRSQLVSRLARTPAAGVVAIGCTAAAVGLFPTSYAPVPTGLLAMAFIIIAGGNTLFGVLTAGVSRMLGEISYGIYLLHGIILFVAFYLLIPNAQSLSGTAHCLVAVLCTPVLVAIAYFLFTCIERPWIEWAHQRGPRFPRQNAVPEAAAAVRQAQLEGRVRARPAAARA